MHQVQLEKLIHPQWIRHDIIELIKKEFNDELNDCVEQYKQYCSKEYWDSKNARLSLMLKKDLTEIFAKLLCNILILCQEQIPFISICSSMSFGFKKSECFQTVAELLHIMSDKDWFIIETKTDTRYIQSTLALPEKLDRRMQISCVLPPMVIRPRKLLNNKSSGFATIHNDSLILGYKENHHNKEISLDVLNKLNSTRLELDKDIIYKFEKELCCDVLSKKQFDKLSEEEQETYLNQVKTHEKMKEQFEFFRDKLLGQDLYLTHKVDKRGRVYSQGYHFNTQGSSFEKACINLKTKEYVEGEL